MKFNIITRCTRLGNIETVKESVFSNLTPNTEVDWHVVFDTNNLKDIDAELLNRLSDDNTTLHFRKGDGWGLSQLNDLIHQMDGWVYHVDDDNTVHPDFYKTIEESYAEDSNVEAFIFAQFVGGKDFSKLEVREARPVNVAVSKIDLAQWLIHSDLHRNYSYGSGYTADGEFIVNLYENEKDSFRLINKVLCNYNDLEKKSKARIPKVIYIGPGEPKLESRQFVSYEAKDLDVRYFENDENLLEEIVSFNPDAIVTVGESWMQFPTISSLPIALRRKWLHYSEKTPVEDMGHAAYTTAMNTMLNPNYLNDEETITFFTPIYNTGEKLYNTYMSLVQQTYRNWEWVMVNDSTDGGKTLKIAEDIASGDPRVKVYDFREKSGGIIGEVKYRACVLSKGYILAELDHDDLLTENAAQDLHNAAQKHPECGFFYTDCTEWDEAGNSLRYDPGFAFNYGQYRKEEYAGKEVWICNQHDINPKTIRHIVGVPNHIRAWRRTTYFEIGGHNRGLSIADDYELVVRTFLKTKMCRIPKLAYIQYLYNNENGQNTHDLSRNDIQRRVKTIMYYYNDAIAKRFEELGLTDWAYETFPGNPLMTPSKYGEEEQVANVTYVEEGQEVPEKQVIPEDVTSW